VFSEAESVYFSGACFLFLWSTNRVEFLFNEDLSLNIKGFRILLDQGAPNRIDQDSPSIQRSRSFVVQIW